MVKMAMIEKFLPAAGKMRSVMASYQAWKGLLPAQSEPLQFFEKRAVDQWRLIHFVAAALTCEMILVRIVSGVCPSA